MKKQSVFISHSTNDDDFVLKLSKDLESNGIKTWVDDAEILPGDDFISKIESGLKTASHVLIIFSPHSIISEWVKEETHASQIRAIRENIRLIPILIGGFDPQQLPILMQSRIYLDFSSDVAYQDTFKKLMSSFSGERIIEATNVPICHIEECNILSHSHQSKYALELLITNPTNFPVFFKSLTILSVIIPDHSGISYFQNAPTVSYSLNLNSLEKIEEGFTNLKGTITSSGDEWGRTIIGNCITSHYISTVEISFPLYLELQRGDKGILRLIFNEFLNLLKGNFYQQNVNNILSTIMLDTINKAPLINSNVKSHLHQSPWRLEEFSGFIFRTDTGTDITGKILDPFLFNLVPSKH